MSRNTLALVIVCIALLNFEIGDARGIKRIKRNPSDGKEAKNSKQGNEEFSLSNADKTLSKKDNAQQEQQNNQMEHHEHNSNGGAHGNEANIIYDKMSDSKLGGLHPLSFILQNRDHGLKDRHHDHHLNHAAEVVIIDNNGAAIRPLASTRVVDPIAVAEISSGPHYGNFDNGLHHRPEGETNYIVSGMSHLSALPQPMGFHPPPNPFGPIEQMFKLANMIMYKNDATPMHGQGTAAQLTLLPANGGANDMVNDNIDTVDYLYNTVDNPADNHPLTPVMDSDRAVFYGPPFIFKQPVSATNTKKVINLIENAIDSVYNGNGGLSHMAGGDDMGQDTEIELHCPIHHGKKSVDSKNNPNDKSLAETGKGDGVIQVCSCRLIKKKRG